MDKNAGLIKRKKSSLVNVGESSEVWVGPLHFPPEGLWPIWTQASLGW